MHGTLRPGGRDRGRVERSDDRDHLADHRSAAVPPGCGAARTRRAPVRAMRARRLLAVLAFATAGGCHRDARVAVEIDLARQQVCRIGDRFAPAPLETVNGSPQLVQRGVGTVEFYVRMPENSSLSLGPACELPAGMASIVIRSDDRERTLEQGEHSAGACRADLREFDRQVVSIAFRSGSTEVVTWGTPRITGLATPL